MNTTENRTGPATVAEQPQPTRRRNPRMAVDFSVTLSSLPDAPEPFEQKAEACTISTAGATLICDAALAEGTTLYVELPFGGKFKAEVNGVWKNEQDGRQRIGVRLLDGATWFTD